ncbi:glycosyl hydrolase family 28-related protein [Rhodococcus erythropolis]|uniref:Glycosyl hydrolase family 28-related protein n=1 Tax=Rhodococcus erythropolis TaxID=1833 RepID=A0AAX3ZZH1_RHOER|nr:glycosyl hydrolase family 28-related protein [Rhodococcus erythropolis]WMN01929.1 glycosyl hydrolase family 28-related protein [Rhodococcus erythropolis]
MANWSSALSRRKFLGMFPAALALPATQPESFNAVRRVENGGDILDVRDFGAVGDGAHDDSIAIGNAVAELKSGDVLLFPSGQYRFAQRHPTGGAAISIVGISYVSIDFDTGAELLMDNLDDNGAGTSHGIVFRGPLERVSLRNVAVRWASQPALRSMGDGIRVVGYASDTSAVLDGWTGPGRPASWVTLSDCRVESSPQAGVIMMGVSDITVDGLHVENTMADGLHFNACRRGTVERFSATNTGDDGLALVTYYSPEAQFDRASETFAFPTLTEWSNADFDVTGVHVSGGAANGVRLAGVDRSTVADVVVEGVSNGAGVMVDSASPDSGTGWHYVASRGVQLNGLSVADSHTGLHVLARPNGSIGDAFNRFDLELTGVAVDNCLHWSFLVESIADPPVTGILLSDCTVTDAEIGPGTAAVGLQRTQDVSLGTVSITTAKSAVAFSADNSAQFTIDQLNVTVTGPPLGSEAGGPFVVFQGSSGTVVAADLVWEQAPSSWLPVLTFSDSCVGGTPTNPEVTVGTVTTTPLKAEPIFVACR